jgi:hypothetical protein
MAVRTAVSRLIEDVYAGKLNPKIASGLAPLLNLQLRAIESSDLEHRLTKLQDLHGKLAEYLDELPSSELDPSEDHIASNTLEGTGIGNDEGEALEKADGF